MASERRKKLEHARSERFKKLASPSPVTPGSSAGSFAGTPSVPAPRELFSTGVSPAPALESALAREAASEEEATTAYGELAQPLQKGKKGQKNKKGKKGKKGKKSKKNQCQQQEDHGQQPLEDHMLMKWEGM